MDSLTPTIRPELLVELLKSAKKPEDIFGPDGLLHRLKGALMERMLEAEMSDHLGFEANDADGHGSGNSRNGHSGKTVQSITLPSNSNVEKAKADTVPRAMRVSMLAVRARARTTAERMNGHPAQNTTGVVRTAVA